MMRWRCLLVALLHALCSNVVGQSACGLPAKERCVETAEHCTDLNPDGTAACDYGGIEAVCVDLRCVPALCSLSKETPGYVVSRRPGLPLPAGLNRNVSTVLTSVSPLGRVAADSFLHASAGASPVFEDLGSVTCAAGYGLDVTCSFQSRRATGATTRVPVLGASTREQCAERVMSLHPRATGASFEEEVNGRQWCDALLDMTKCDLNTTCLGNQTCVMQWSEVDRSRPAAFEGDAESQGYTCSDPGESGPLTCARHTCPETPTPLDDLDADPGSIVCPGTGCTDAMCCTGRGRLSSNDICLFSDLPAASCGAEETSASLNTATVDFAESADDGWEAENCDGDFECTTDSCPNGCPDKWSGGVLGQDGRIYGIPHNSKNLLVIEPNADTPTTHQYRADAGTYAHVPGQNKWRGGVLAPNGMIFGVPFNNRRLLIIEPGQPPATRDLSLPDSLVSGRSQHYGGGALAANGKIYFAPYRMTHVLKVEPSAAVTESQLYTGAFCTPSTCDSTVIELCPVTSPCPQGSPLVGNYKWSGVVLAPNQKLYFIPYSIDRVLIVDPAAQHVVDQTLRHPGFFGSNKWDGGVLATNGKIYGIPASSDKILVIEPESDTVILLDLPSSSIAGYNVEAHFKWRGGSLAPNGLIYAAPRRTNCILVIDPNDNAQTGVITDGDGSMMDDKWGGATLGANGNVHFIPARKQRPEVLSPAKRFFEFSGCQKNCPVDKYLSSESGCADCCMDCPARSSTVNTTGRKEISDCLCDPGYFGTLTNDNSCDPCPEDHYKASSGTAPCTPCPSNSGTHGQVGQTSCLCNSGSAPILEDGWTVVLKTSGNEIFQYNSTLWTESHAGSVLNPSSPLVEPGDAKYSAYNTLDFTEVKVCTSTSSDFSSSRCLSHTLTAPVESAAALFGGTTIGEGVNQSDFRSIFSAVQTPPPGAVRVGTVTVGSDAQTIHFGNAQRQFNSPVVILGIPEKPPGSPAAVVMRLSDVQHNRFSVYVDVPSRPSAFGGLCGFDEHGELEVSWAVVSSGVYENSSNNEAIHAGLNVSAADFSWSNVHFARPFGATPAVVSQVQTHNGDDWVKTRQQNSSHTGFAVRLEGDGIVTYHANETIGWLAVSRGDISVFGSRFSAFSAEVDAGAGTIVSFSEGFLDVPAVFGTVASFREQDEVHLRLVRSTETSSSQATLVLEEERCGDDDITHIPEEVHAIAISAEATGALIGCSESDVASTSADQGFNVVCQADTHKVRWGFCSDGADVICNNIDGSEGSVGLGLSHQVGAGSVYNTHTVFQKQSRLQAWVLVRNSEVPSPAAACSLCAVDTYKTEPGQSTCERCPANTSTYGMSLPFNASTKCKCKPGYSAAADGVECNPCPQNKYAEDFGSRSCSDCPSHSTTAGAVGCNSRAQCLCDPGYTMVDNTQTCTACPADHYKSKSGNGECHACSAQSSTYGVTGATNVSFCQCIAGHSTTDYTGTGALGRKALAFRFSGDANEWTGGQADRCGGIGTFLRASGGSSSLHRTFSLAQMPTHTMLQIDFDLVMIDAAFGDVGLVSSSVSIGTSSIVHTSTGGSLWGRAKQWTCADILQVNSSAVDGVYSITVPSSPEALRVFCDMTGGGWMLVQTMPGSLTVTTDEAVNATWLAAEGASAAVFQNVSQNGKLSRSTIVDLCDQQYKLVTDGGVLSYCSFDTPTSYCDQCDVQHKQCNETFNGLGYYAAPGLNRGTHEGVGFNIGIHGTPEWTQVWCRAHPVVNSSANQCGNGAPELTQHVSVDSIHVGNSVTVNITELRVEIDNGVDAPVVDTPSERHGGIGLANVQLLPGFLDTFENSMEGWSSAQVNKLYFDNADWQIPDWRKADVQVQISTDVTADASACMQQCEHQHLLHTLYPELEGDCELSSFGRQVRDGQPAQLCYSLLRPGKPLRRTVCTTANDAASFGIILGGYNVLGVGNSVRKSFDLSAYPHDEVTVSLEFIKVDAWQNQSASVYIDGRKVWSQSFVGHQGAQVCGNTRTDGAVGNEAKVAVGPFVLRHSGPSVEIQVGMDNYVRTPTQVAWFGIDNVRVLPKLQWCEECGAAAFKGSRGNQDCTPCPEFSQTPHRGSLDVASCVCNAGYVGEIESLADRCSVLPSARAVPGEIGAPVVSVAWLPDGDGPPCFNKKLTILGNVTSQQDVELVWSAPGTLVQLGDVARTPVVATRSAGAAQIVPLVIHSDALYNNQGHSNSFTFRLTASVGQLSSYAEVTVVMNAPPSLGWLHAEPSNGISVETVYNLSAVQWFDEDLPLTYRFFAQIGENQIPLARTSTESALSTILPAGSRHENNTLQYVASIRDEFGSSATARGDVVVMPYQMDPDDATLQLATATASGDAFAIQRLVSAFASSMSTEASPEALQMRESLVSSLNSSIAAMEAGSAEWSPEVLTGYLGAVSVVTSPFQHMSLAATELGMDVLSSLVERLQPEDATIVVTAASNLLGATENIARFSSNQSSVDEVLHNQLVVQRSMVQLGSILERTAVAMANGLVVGEHPSMIATDRFKLSAHVGPLGNATGSSDGQTSRHLPPGSGRPFADTLSPVSVAPESLAGTSVYVTQLVEWVGAGPHFWAGRNLTATRPWAPSYQAATTMGSSVLTVSFFDHNGSKLSVKNLATPATLRMVVPPDIAVGGIHEQLLQLSTEVLRKRAKAYNETAVDLHLKTKPQLIELLLAVPEIANVASAVYCAYWDTAALEWKVDREGRIHRVGDAFFAECDTTHFTDFAAFLGPLPQINRLGDLSDLPHNVTGVRVTIIILVIAFMLVWIGAVEYRWARRGAEATDKDRDLKLRYDKDVAHFARYRRMYRDSNVPWTHRAWIGLRTQWVVGGCIYKVRGDPFQCSQRMFIVTVHILVSMALNILFFDDYIECVYSCDTHMPAGIDDMTTADPACVPCPFEQALETGGTCGLVGYGPVDEGSRVCTAEEENPGLMASLVTVVFIAPMIGAVNLAFAWLRKPLIIDIMVRSGEIWKRLQSESAQERAQKREELMLEAMSLHQMFEYAAQEVEQRGSDGIVLKKPRVSAEKLNNIVAESTVEQREHLSQLQQELKEHVSKQGIKSNLTVGHQDCVQQIFNIKREADERTKVELSKVLLGVATALARANLAHVLNDLSLPELRQRAKRHLIQYEVEDEDAWSGEPLHDVSDLDLHLHSPEERQMALEQRKEAEDQIASEKAELIDLVVNAECARTNKAAKVRHCIMTCRPRDAASHCMEVQRHSCAQVFPCCQKMIKVRFDEDGPLGVKFALRGDAVQLSAIKEYYQADLHESLRPGLLLQNINGTKLPTDVQGLSLKKFILTQLHTSTRPIALTFIPGEEIIVSDSDEEDGTDLTDKVGDAQHRVSSFWDWENIPEEVNDSALLVEDLTNDHAGVDAELEGQSEVNARSTTDGDDASAEGAPHELREHGASLVACQHLVDTVHALEKETALSKKYDLQQAQRDLERAQLRVATSAAAAEYSFESCTIHIEKLPDSIGQTDIETTFSVFGFVLQATLRRRPGANSNWALVTLAGASCVRACLIPPRKYKRQPTEEQASLLRQLNILRCHEMYSGEYGHSWLEAQERAGSMVRSLATHDETHLRHDFGVFVDSSNESSAQGMVLRRRARVCKRRRQMAAQMRVCEMSVDALFYAHDHDNSGTLDREELGRLMTSLNNGTLASEFSVQFVLDQVRSHGGDSAKITREKLKPAVVLWRYLQHEQDFLAKHFDDFDKRCRGKMIGRNEVGWLLKKLNSDMDNPNGIPPAVAEVDWVMRRARQQGGDNVNRSQLRSAIALWYPCVHNRRRVEDVPASMQIRAGRTRKAVAAMLSAHKHHMHTVMQRRYPVRYDPENPSRVIPYNLSSTDLGNIMSDLSSKGRKREKVGQEMLEYVASIADLEDVDNFEPEDVESALAVWLCNQEVQPFIDAALGQYDEKLKGSEQRQQVHNILTLLNDGISTTLEETDWILESSDVDGNGSISMEELRASVGLWFLHVVRRKVQAEKGYRALTPWIASATLALVCACLVAAISVRFTEEKTQRWLENTTIAVLAKLVLLDPLKTLLCGTWLEPATALCNLDLGLAAVDLSEATSEAIGIGEDLSEATSEAIGIGEDSIHDVGIALAAYNGKWEPDTKQSKIYNRKEENQNTFLAGSRTIAKLRGAVQERRVKSKALAAATEATRDSQKHLQRLASQRVEMNSVYAQIVAQKRLAKGLNRGEFAARTEKDMAAVTQFMASEQTHLQEELRALQEEIRTVSEQEQQMLGELQFQALVGRANTEGVDKRRLQQIVTNGDEAILQRSAIVDLILEHVEQDKCADQSDVALELERMRVHTPDDTFVSTRELDKLRVLRGKKKRAEKKRQLLLDKRDEADHEAGTDGLLIDRVRREAEQHERHIAHLRGLSNAKTAERVRRKRLGQQEMPTVSISVGRAVGLLGRLMSNRAKVSVRTAESPNHAGPQRTDEDPEARPSATAASPLSSADRADTTSALALAQRGMHRSATNPKQLKVTVPSGRLPNANTPSAGLIDELNVLFPELVKK